MIPTPLPRSSDMPPWMTTSSTKPQSAFLTTPEEAFIKGIEVEMRNAVLAPSKGYTERQMASLQGCMDLKATERQHVSGIWVDLQKVKDTQEARLVLSKHSRSFRVQQCPSSFTTLESSPSRWQSRQACNRIQKMKRSKTTHILHILPNVPKSISHPAARAIHHALHTPHKGTGNQVWAGQPL